MTASYEELAISFEACEIDASNFTHADHVGVAYQLLRRHDFLDAAFRYSNCIKAIAANAGAAQKFNTTITLAFLSLIAERIETTAHDGYGDFLDKNTDLLDARVITKWYTPARLESDLARTMFLMPDSVAA